MLEGHADIPHVVVDRTGLIPLQKEDGSVKNESESADSSTASLISGESRYI